MSYQGDRKNEAENLQSERGEKKATAGTNLTYTARVIDF